MNLRSTKLEGTRVQPTQVAASRRPKAALRLRPNSLQGCSAVYQGNEQEPEMRQRCNAEVSLPNYNDRGGSRGALALGNILVENVAVDGRKIQAIKCNHKRCKLCDVFEEVNTFKSTTTGKRFMVNHNGQATSCNTTNVIYLLTCKGCKAQYVGETAQQYNERMNDTRNRIKNYQKGGSHNTLLVEHFALGRCEGEEYTCHIIENRKGNGRSKTGKMDQQETFKRVDREKYWMKKFKTISLAWQFS